MQPEWSRGGMTDKVMQRFNRKFKERSKVSGTERCGCGAKRAQSRLGPYHEFGAATKGGERNSRKKARNAQKNRGSFFCDFCAFLRPHKSDTRPTTARPRLPVRASRS